MPSAQYEEPAADGVLGPLPATWADGMVSGARTVRGAPPGRSLSGRKPRWLRQERLWEPPGKDLEKLGPPEAAPDLEQVLPVIEPGERRRLLEHSRQLATNPLFQTWMPALEELTPWVDKLQEIKESPLVLSEPQKQARGDALVDEATLVLYPAEARPLWRRRLLAMAYRLDLGQHPEEARMARAAADDLGDPERSAVAGENPFLKSLVQVALRLSWDRPRKLRRPKAPPDC